QLDAVLPQNSSYLALVAVELAYRAVHQQLRALADVRKRRLQLVRHVPQKSAALLRQVEQPPAQPFELPAHALQVLGTRDADRLRQRPAAELADRAIQRAQRAAHCEGDRD